MSKVKGNYENGIKMTPEYFGPLWEFIDDDAVTDIDINDGIVWLTDICNRRWEHDCVLSKPFMEQFCERIANSVSENFNKQNPVLEAQTDRLRISVGHESVVRTGRSICIRKTLPFLRFTAKEAVESGYCPERIIHLLANYILAGCRIVVGGDVGAGKTELAKFLSKYIPKKERVITIEDSLEWHYADINPGADAVALQINKCMGYSDAIKFALRQHSSRIMLSEARSSEVEELMEAWSTGTSGISSLHLDDVRKMPDRLLNMRPGSEGAERFTQHVYQFVDVCILVAMKNTGKIGDSGEEIIIRRIEQVAFFDYDNTAENKYVCNMIVDDGGILPDAVIPKSKLERMRKKRIDNPWKCDIVDAEMHPVNLQ